MTDRLRLMAEMLPQLPAIVTYAMDSHIEYSTHKTNGTDDDAEPCVGEGIYVGPNNEIALQVAFMEAGSSIDPHIHPNELEILIVYSKNGTEGKLKVETKDTTVVLGPGALTTIGKGVSHIATALEDTWMIGITIPAAEGYPDVKTTK